MRWLTPGPHDEPDRRAALDRVDRFWRSFAPRARWLAERTLQGATSEVAAWSREAAEALSPGGALHVEPIATPRAEAPLLLVVSPASSAAQRPFVDALVARAPTVDGWSFSSLLPPLAVDVALARAHATLDAQLHDVRALPSHGDLGDIDLFFTSPPWGRDDPAGLVAARSLARSLLGDDLLERWVAHVEVGPPPAAARAAPLADLHDLVRHLAADRLADLPSTPFAAAASSAPWSMFRRDPRRRADYPGRADLFVGTTMLPAAWRAAHAGRPFRSCRHSRHDELLCYVKLDADSLGARASFADRHDVEHALSAALGPDRLGCVVGAASGLRYAYVDLALPLSRLHRAIDACRRALAPSLASPRAWLLFFDDHLADEWVGLRDDTPPPPR